MKALIRDRRLNAGPWYTALDMNCLSGETIVRNLLLGHTTIVTLSLVFGDRPLKRPAR